MKNWIIKKLEQYGFYKIENLVNIGMCGICGVKMKGVFSKHWAVGICKNCEKEI